MNIESLSSARPLGVAGSKDTVASTSSPADRAGPRASAGPDAAGATARPNARELDTALGKINKSMADKGQDLVFSIDPDSERTIVKIVDQTTKEVLRQIPSKEALDIAKALDSAQGLLIKQTA
jgi:flagellar protein FlaG